MIAIYPVNIVMKNQALHPLGSLTTKYYIIEFLIYNNKNKDFLTTNKQ